MSWRDYQDTLGSSERKRRMPRFSWRSIFFRGGGIFLSLALIFLLGLVGTSEWQSFRSSESGNTEGNIDPQEEARNKIRESLRNVSISEMGSNVDLAVDEGQIWQAELTLDQDLQTFVERLLKRNRVDWAGVAVMDCDTGAVLTLASHSEKEPNREGLSIAATFPAASIFKVVTAAAALQEGRLRRGSSISFNGSSSRIVEKELKRVSGRYAMTFEKAFAKSANLIFGKIGAQKLGGDLLQKYALEFGFNENIPFDGQLAISDAEIPIGNLLQEARTAAGFGKVHLSPLHGAMIASTIAADGKMMTPYVVSKAIDEAGEIAYQTNPKLWKRPIQSDVASEMRQMMHATISQGTARKWFRNMRRHPILQNLDIGGKTGSLSGRDPWGKHEWFVGYARSRSRKIAVGIVTVSEKYWRIKPSKIAREIFEFQFAPKPIIEAIAPAKVKGGRNGGS